MRISEPRNARSIFISVDPSGQLRVKAAVKGAGSTAPGTAYMMLYDDYGWTASTMVTNTSSLPRFMIGIAEKTVSSHSPTGVGLSTELFEFVIGGPTILQSTLATGTTGQSLQYTTGGMTATGATYSGLPWEWAIFRNAWNPLTNGYTTSPLLSTKDTQYGAMSTGTQAILLLGERVVQG